jgi:pimeloyl-ACP methyl ester carboxylesterase
MVRVREYGTSGPFVAVLHGGPGAPGYMAAVARRLGQAFRVLEPLQRGSGQEPLTVARHVADLHEVIACSYGGSRVALVGHSWGAMLALAYAAEHGDRVASVVLIGSGTFTVATRQRFHAILDARTDESLRQRVRALDLECPDPDERLERRARFTLPLYSFDIGGSDPGFEGCDARAHQETWGDMVRLQEEGVYPRAFEAIRAPVLMLHGAADPHPGEMIRASLEPYIPQIEYVEWEHCGHYPWLEPAARDEFFRIMIEWLQHHTDI